MCFLHGQGQKSEQKPKTQNFVGFHNHSPLLTMIKLTMTFLVIFKKLNRDKLALIKRRGSLKRGERLTIATGSLMKIDQHDNFTRVVSRRYRER